MTSVVRYVKNTSTAPNINIAVNSTGSDYQLIAIDMLLAQGINANANANVFQWGGTGTIKSIASIFMRVNTGEIIPMGAVAQNTHSIFTLDATGKIINCSIPAAGAAIPANTTISFLLVIGNY